MPPVIIGAGIAAAATVGGAAITSKSNNKAISKTVAAQQQSDAQQIALQREVYGKNEANIAPFMARGNAAGDTINALLGLGGSTTVPQGQQGLPTPQGALQVPWQGDNPDSTGGVYGRGYLDRAGMEPVGASYGAMPWGGQATAQTAGPAQQSPQQAALAAYDIFKQSTGYQSRLKEGMSALSANFFGGGIGQSGAAMKAALRTGQDYASGEFGKYLGYLGNQQGVGFAGASALAGVSQGFADRMGDISQNGANVASQAAIARAQNSGALTSAIAGAAGQIGGALSSYGSPQYTAPGGGIGGGLNTAILPSQYAIPRIRY